MVGQLAALLGISSAQIEADLANVQYSLYKPVPILENAPLSDVLYIGEHASMFPGVSTVADTNRTYPLGQTGVQMLGYVGQISSQQLQAHQSQGYQLGDLYGQSGLENQYEADLRGTPGVDRVEVDAHGQVVGSLGETPPAAGRRPRHQHRRRARADPAAGARRRDRARSRASPPAARPSPSTPRPGRCWRSCRRRPTTRRGGPTGSPRPTTTRSRPPARRTTTPSRASTPRGRPSSWPRPPPRCRPVSSRPGYTYNDTGAYTIPGCTTGGAGAPPTTTTRARSAAGSTCPRRSRCRATSSSTTSGSSSGTPGRGRYGKTPIQDAAAQLGYGDVDRDRPARRDRTSPGWTRPGRGQREHAQDPKDYPNGGWFTGNNLELAFGQGGTVITPLEQAVAYATFANGGTRYVPEVAAGIVDAHGKVVRTIAPKVAGHVTYLARQLPGHAAGLRGGRAELQGHRLRRLRRLPPVHASPWRARPGRPPPTSSSPTRGSWAGARCRTPST